MRLLVYLLLLLVVPLANAEPSRKEGACGVSLPNEWYYFVSLDEIPLVSEYFKGLPEVLFDDLEGFTLSMGTRHRRDTYFDFDSEELLHAGKELFFRENLYLPRYRDDREQVVFVDRDESIRRHVYKVKKYKKNISPLDKHPLVGRVRRKDRPMLRESLGDTSLGNAMLDLKAQLTVLHQERSYIFTHLGEEYGSIVLDHVSMRVFGLEHSAVVLRFSLKGQVSSPEDRQLLEEYFCRVQQALEQRLGRSWNGEYIGYKEYRAMADGVLPNRRWMMNHPWVYKLGQVLILAVMGFLILYLLIRRLPDRTPHRVVLRKQDGGSD